VETRPPGSRDEYRRVGEVSRVAIERAISAGRLRGSDLKVLLAILHLLTTRSRLWDFTSHGQIAGLAGVARRSVIRSVGALSTLKVIRWEPGGPGELSRVSFDGVVTPPRHQASSRDSDTSTSPQVVTKASPLGDKTGPNIVTRKWHTSEKGPSNPKSAAVRRDEEPPRYASTCRECGTSKWTSLADGLCSECRGAA
jgi:hypothetical protein